MDKKVWLVAWFLVVACSKAAGPASGTGGFSGAAGTATGGIATGGTTAGQGGLGTGGRLDAIDATAGSGAGGTRDAGLSTLDSESADAPAAQAEVAVSDGRIGVDGDGIPSCKNSNAVLPSQACRSVNDCGPTGPVKCCTSSPCWPASACPISPATCSGGYGKDIFKCTTDQDCNAGGTCVSIVSGCPQCESRSCNYPPPPPPACTSSPDSCSPSGRCQPDGGCAPVLCTDGYKCSADSRCKVASARADGHGCELLPCDDGWTCDENTRCTTPSDRNSHGCTTMTCKKDSECDCGYCVNGICSSSLGSCSFAPQ
jgi:hypothetical protein